MSILSTSPTNTRTFDAQIATALGDFNAAVIVQQLHYWMQKEGVGTIINNVKYIYNTFVDWVNEQFPWLSVWQFRKAMTLLRSLGIVKVIRHKAKEWNQTNFYTLDRDRLAEFLNLENERPTEATASESCKARRWCEAPFADRRKVRRFGSPQLMREEATSTETKQLCVTASQNENNQLLEMRDPNISYIEPKITNQKKQQSRTLERSQSKALGASKMLAAASSKVKKIESYSNKPSTVAHSSAATVREKENKSSYKQNTDEDKNVVKVDYIVNFEWKEQVKDLDDAGIQVNKTLITLLKTHKSEEVANAIALFKTRKREQYIPNPCGYFTEALKQNWADEESSSTKVDIADLFRYWYDLARKLGYCSGQEMRDGVQWVCLSGTWEKWSDAVERGYSVDYFNKILKRNGGKS